MAIDEAPPFWWQKNAWQGWVLSPLGLAYGKASGRRMEYAPSGSVPVPVICVGNFIIGGAGKTPTVQLISRFARSRGLRPGVLTRGYGGAISSPTVVVRDRHNSHDVGDEALLHARHAVTVVATDRVRGAEILVGNGCDLILMDDGFQNPALEKDYNLVVVDAKRGLGNGFAVPAGPVRAPFRLQVKHADAVLVIGDGDGGDAVIRRCARSAKPVFTARIRATGTNSLTGRKFVAYAGIADPSKFFDSLKEARLEVVHSFAFGDHHVFSEQECDEILERARSMEADLITTAKDAARLDGRGRAQTELLEASEILHITVEPEDPNMLDRIIDAAQANCAKRLLRAKKSA